MQKELNPVVAIIAIVVILVVILGLGWKFLFAPPPEVTGTAKAPPASLGPPAFQTMEEERAALRNRKSPR